MLNIVIPMAGAGSRFATQGYAMPKPLIPVHGVPMIKLVINNLRPRGAHRFIFICQKRHISEYGLKNKLERWAPGCILIGIEGVTAGAACSVLMAKKYINNSEQLMIANSDQYIDIDINNYLIRTKKPNLDGLIMTMNADDPKWSFVGMNDAREVTRVVEKQVISNEATVGIYNFSRGCDFVSSAEKMIEKNLQVNGEFYVAPVYNEQIELGGKVETYNIGSESGGMYGLGIPEDLEKFLTHPVSRRAIEAAP